MKKLPTQLEMNNPFLTDFGYYVPRSVILESMNFFLGLISVNQLHHYIGMYDFGVVFPLFLELDS